MGRKSNPCITEVVGGFWGDEGKGRVASYESTNARLVLRTTGGNNAGHTVYYKGDKIPLHLVPGGIIYPQTIAIICNGVLVDADVLYEEIQLLSNYISVTPEKLIISDRAHMIFPYHINLDDIQEKRRGKNKIGTTHRGIGPTAQDRCGRIGIRFQDLFRKENELKELINLVLDSHAQELLRSNISYNTDFIYEYCMKVKDRLEAFIKNPDIIISNSIYMEEKIVIEGAQADHLDIINGDYPNCTSTECNPSGTLSGAGIGPTLVDKVIVTMKAYCSRVGNGPFPTELFGKEGNTIRELGHEYGTTTGRPRRCGWLDLVALSNLRGYTDICLNHLDTIGLVGKELGHIKICTSYLYQNEKYFNFPSDIEVTKEIPTPIYEEFKGGWTISKKCNNFDQLPKRAKDFVNFIEDYTNIPVTYIGIGPNNEDTIIRKNR